MAHILNHGDSVLAYDLTTLQASQDLNNLKHQKYIPDVIIVKKYYGKKERFWKLRRLEMDFEEEGETDNANTKGKGKKQNKELEM